MGSEFLSKLRKSLILTAILIVVPLIPKIGLLFTWPVLVSILFGFLLNMTQPDVKGDDAATNSSRDRGSVWAIYVGGSLAFLVPLIEYAYYKVPPRPEMRAFFSQVGLFVMVFGFLLRIWSIRTLGQFFTSVVTIKEGHKVIQSGPYRWVRHPSYTGAFALMVGMSVIYRSFFGLLVCFAILLPIYLYRIRVEEETLQKELGKEYTTYMQRTKRLIPFLV